MAVTLAKYSTTNVLNTVAEYVATKLLAAGYLVYWHARDTVQIDTTPTGWYPSFSQNRAAYAADSTFSTAVSNAIGLVTLVNSLPADPRFVIRLMSDASVGEADEVPVPAIALEIGAGVPVSSYEVGSRKKWRSRHLVLDGYFRDENESMLMEDLFTQWFDDDDTIAILDHDAGTQAAIGGDVYVMDSVVRALPHINQGDALTYEVILNAQLIYVV